MKSSSHTDVYQMVTDLIIEKLESGIVPWRKPWNDYGPAVNYLSKKPYRGINHLILNGLHVKPFYLTFHQTKSLGGRIKKGAKSIPIVYWNFIYRHKETKRKIAKEDIYGYPVEKIVKTAFLKYYRVFNIDNVLDIEFDIPKLIPDTNICKMEQCDAVLFEMKDRPEICHNENQAYYDPTHDYINMPPIEFFKTSELYYSILHHEARPLDWTFQKAEPF